MANIRIDLQDLVDGMEVVFQAPADCSQVTGLIVYYPSTEDSSEIYKEFSFVDAHNNDLTDIDELFAADAYVKVILNTVNGKAYIQNGDTNGYLEQHIQSRNPHGTTASDVGALPISLKGQALRVSDLMATFAHPTLVEWDSNTSNTPYKAGLTTGAEGFAIVHGEYSGWHTVVAWQKGGTSPKMWVHHVNQGTNFGWKEPLWADGSVVMIQPLKFFTDKGFVGTEYSSDITTTYLRSIFNDVSYLLDISNHGVRYIEGTKDNKWGKAYSLYGEHNMCPDGAGAHNATYRGKYLGTAVTDEQWARINDGTFRDLYIGDYWTIGGINYRIAAFDYYYNTGDTACTKHHVTLVPDTNMYTHVMNDTNITTGAYVGSKMYTEGLTQAKTTINNAFGSAHILNHRQLLPNATTNDYESGHSWYDSTVELMTEHNVYGGKIFKNALQGTNFAYNHTIDKSQYPLFAFRPDMISNRQWFWLRDVASSAHFASVGSNGDARNIGASDAGGVRPAFSIIS